MQKSICDRHIDVHARQILVCVPWGQQPCESVRRLCFDCGCELAMSKESEPVEQRLGLKPVCMGCAIRLCIADPDSYLFSGFVYKGRVTREIE